MGSPLLQARRIDLENIVGKGNFALVLRFWEGTVRDNDVRYFYLVRQPLNKKRRAGESLELDVLNADISDFWNGFPHGDVLILHGNVNADLGCFHGAIADVDIFDKSAAQQDWS